MSEQHKGIIALVILAWVFSMMGVFARFLDTEFALFEQTYLRIGLALLLGVVIFGRSLSWSKLKTLPQKDWWVLIFRSITLYIGVTAFTEALINTNYGNASFIASLPLLPILGYFLLKEKLKWATVASIGVGVMGVLLIAVQDVINLSFGYGELMALISVVAFNLSYVARRWHSEHLSNKESTVFMFAIGTVFLFATSLLLSEPFPTAANFTPLIILTLVLAALFNVANLFLTNYGFQRVKVGVAGNLLTLETVFALLYSVFLYQEIPGSQELLGGFLILASVYLVNKFET